MAFCALSIQPLITSLQVTSTAKQCSFADDAGGTGSTTEESVRRKLGEKFRSLRARITRMLKKSREKLFETANINFKCNPERLWSVLKINSKTRSILELVSMETEHIKPTADTPEI